MLALSLRCISMMIYMRLRLTPQIDRTDEMVHALRLQIGRTLVQPGCRECVVSQDVEETNIVLYQEEWNSWEEIEKHIRSERFSRILEIMELSDSTPGLSFCDVRETRGMEYVRKLRTGKNG
jgi:quinol monooxygenase YgiN